MLYKDLANDDVHELGGKQPQIERSIREHCNVCTIIFIGWNSRCARLEFTSSETLIADWKFKFLTYLVCTVKQKTRMRGVGLQMLLAISEYWQVRVPFWRKKNACPSGSTYPHCNTFYIITFVNVSTIRLAAQYSYILLFLAKAFIIKIRLNYFEVIVSFQRTARRRLSDWKNGSLLLFRTERKKIPRKGERRTSIVSH